MFISLTRGRLGRAVWGSSEGHVRLECACTLSWNVCGHKDLHLVVVSGTACRNLGTESFPVRIRARLCVHRYHHPHDGV